MRLRLAVVLLPVALAAVFAVHLAQAGPARVTIRPDGTLDIPPAARAAGLRFAPTVAPADRAWILAAIAHARPEARELIGEVDGLVTVDTDLPSIGGGDITPVGVTRPLGTSYTVAFNLAQLDGQYARDRDDVVLHELGHVVDFALIPPATDARLNAGIPNPGACDAASGPFGGCAPARERIADTFAKWALGGAVSLVGAGYQIPMPASLETWGAPLDALAAQLPPD